MNFAASKKQRMGSMMKAVSPASAEDALKKTRMPIYFSKKLSPVKQVRRGISRGCSMVGCGCVFDHVARHSDWSGSYPIELDRHGATGGAAGGAREAGQRRPARADQVKKREDNRRRRGWKWG